MEAKDIRPGMLFIQRVSSGRRFKLWVASTYNPDSRTWSGDTLLSDLSEPPLWLWSGYGNVFEQQLSEFQFCGRIPPPGELLAGCLLSERNPELKLYDEEDQQDEDLEDAYYGEGEDETEDL